MPIDDFIAAASSTLTLHYSAAQHLVPVMRGAPGSSYTFVLGGAGPRGLRTPLSQINTQTVWGLAAALRAQGPALGIATSEVRVDMCIDRTSDEKLSDPSTGHAFSAELGDVCAGLLTAGGADAHATHAIRSPDDLRALKAMFPAPHVGTELPLQWDISSFAAAL
jgi:hypothetical protein